MQRSGKKACYNSPLAEVKRIAAATKKMLAAPLQNGAISALHAT
jgi:hypothetical protein